jgi:hypothetical protein
MIFIGDREYFLLWPYPIQSDWEPECTFRFVVVPRTDTKDGVYPHARHVVTNANFTIEYSSDMPEILVKLAGNNDVLDKEEFKKWQMQPLP